MAHEILTIKLCQLNERVEKLHARIRLSESADPAQIQREMHLLEKECSGSESALEQSIQRSKAGIAPVLAQGYRQMEAVFQQTRAELQAALAAQPDPECAAEERVLLAEYALDLAQQAADWALLFSMEAIHAQLKQEGRKS